MDTVAFLILLIIQLGVKLDLKTCFSSTRVTLFLTETKNNMSVNVCINFYYEAKKDEEGCNYVLIMLYHMILQTPAHPCIIYQHLISVKSGAGPLITDVNL